ncbi:MAG: hypothetical protein FWG11_05500 [Promicromonosporaceae bacterium]|nr:hypothetical protein [Promicromonosporaceae bacterium]
MMYKTFAAALTATLTVALTAGALLAPAATGVPAGASLPGALESGASLPGVSLPGALLSGASLPGVAASLGATVGRALPDPDATGSLRIERVYSDGSHATDIVDVTACLLTHDGAGGALDLTTIAGWARAADLTQEEAEALPCAESWTSPTVGGIAVFEDLPLGVYLVTNTYNAGTSAGSDASPAFVITIPQTNTAGDGWIYDVVAFPKGQDPYAHIGGIVWYDANRNGLFDDDEDLVEGVRVTLFGPPASAADGGAGAALPVVGVTYTDEDGWWEFTYRPVEVKTVRFDLDPINAGADTFEFTIQGLDSYAHPVTGYADPVQLIIRDWVFVDAGIVREAGPTPPPATPSPSPSPGEPTPTAPPTQPQRPDLPVTGAAIAGALFLGAGALGGGLCLKLAAKRRRSEADTPAA